MAQNFAQYLQVLRWMWQMAHDSAQEFQKPHGGALHNMHHWSGKTDRQTDNMSCKLALLLRSTMLALAPTALTDRQIDIVSQGLALMDGSILHH